MSVKITQTFPSQSNLVTDDYTVLDEITFFTKFSSNSKPAAIAIATNESTYVETGEAEKSITSIGIGDCINIFALGKKNSGDKILFGWHMESGTALESLIKKMRGDYTNSFDIYIIGGNKSTTKGKNCLLNDIYTAIRATFSKGFTIKHELINLRETTGFKCVSANLNLDGTLTLCYHNR